MQDGGNDFYYVLTHELHDVRHHPRVRGGNDALDIALPNEAIVVSRVDQDITTRCSSERPPRVQGGNSGLSILYGMKSGSPPTWTMNRSLSSKGAFGIARSAVDTSSRRAAGNASSRPRSSLNSYMLLDPDRRAGSDAPKAQKACDGRLRLVARRKADLLARLSKHTDRE